jgi:putative SOS response-associated peptidase YedK
MVERYTLTEVRRFNIARGQLAPVDTRDGRLDVRWGLLAPWRGHGGKRGPTIYEATVDMLDSAPVLRTARTKRRCLVRADGWFAWRKLGSKRQAYWIHAPATTAFAGLVATHDDDGIASFALVTVPSAGIVAPIAGVMPAVVDERWLDSPELCALPLERWRADAVSSYFADAAHDDPACVATLGNPAQGELF